MPLRTILLGLLWFASAFVRAQALEIAMPPDRFAGPGEFVTLVVRLVAARPLEVEVAVAAEADWRVLRQPGRVRLEAGRSVPVVATIEVPRDAAALVPWSVLWTFDTGDVRIERRVVVTVTEQVEWDLEVPREHTLGAGELRVTARNLGNVAAEATVALFRGGEVVQVRTLGVAPGQGAELAFDPDDVGMHVVVLTSEGGHEVRRVVDVVRFGVRPPDPFALSAAAVASAATDGALAAALDLRGPLSDFAALEARLEAPNGLRSYAELTLPSATLRLGAPRGSPLGLAMPAAFGVSGTVRHADWTAAVAAGGAAGGAFTGTVGLRWADGTASFAAGAGLAAGRPVVALRADGRAAGLFAAADVGWDGDSGGVGLRTEAAAAGGTIDVRAEARGIGSDRARADLGVRLLAGDDVLYGDARGEFAGEAPWSVRLGASWAVRTEAPGSWRVHAQIGSRESFLQVARRADLGAAWHVSQVVGVRVDDLGAGFTLDAGVAGGGAANVAADARFVYRLASGELEGSLSARYQVDVDAWTLSASGAWEVGTRTLTAAFAAVWREGPWQVAWDATARRDATVGDDGGWNAVASATVGYAFAVPVPQTVTDAFGGRRLGTLAGRVVWVGADATAAAGGSSAEQAGVAGVVVEIGRMRFVTDEAGGFSVDLPPGRYRVAVVGPSVPIAARLLDEAAHDAEVRLRETTEVTWRAAATTALSGRVLVDTRGTGSADDPAAGVVARVLVTDAEGRGRWVATDADGSFVVRGLRAGAVEVSLAELPAGATVVGEGRRTVRLAAGTPAYLEFLVRPAELATQAFAARALRVLRVTLSTDRAPPGSAPLARVTVQGDANAVEIVSGDVVVALVRGDGEWVGRVPVPPDAPDGAWPFVVVARDDDGEASRRQQLVVDGTVEVAVLATDQPVRAGAVLTVTLTAHADVDAVIVASPFGGTVALREAAPGHWEGTLSVPADTADDVWPLTGEVTLADGRTLAVETRFRVLGR